MPGRIRIIGGKWRGRKLDVVEAADLRPTPDRVRETLFNWLQPWIDGATCLDLFAGTGSLGFEALSRGAAGVTMVDSNKDIIDTLQKQAGKLDAKGLEIVHDDAMHFLASRPRRFDIIFLDPPFSKKQLEKALAGLINCDFLHDESLVYIESGDDFTCDETRLHCVKTGRAGNVHFNLLEYSKEAGE